MSVAPLPVRFRTFSVFLTVAFLLFLVLLTIPLSANAASSTPVAIALAKQLKRKQHLLPFFTSRQASSEAVLFTCGNSTAGSRVRKEIRSLSPLELQRWRTAMTTMMTQRPANASFNPPPSFWDLMVAVHIVLSSEAHDGAYFLPWHRYFLLYMENYIRANFYADFALPYWDWSQFTDAPDPALSTVWGTEYLGGSNNSNNSNVGAPIPNGPFMGMRTHYLDSHLIRRGFNVSTSGSMRPLVNASTLEALIRREKEGNWTWGEFSDAVETAHNQVHGDIAGEMRFTATSPNDPVFYLHHAFIDKIWWERQRLFDRNEYGGTHTFSNRNTTLNTTMRLTVNVTSDFVFQYFNLPVNETFEQDCVTYERYVPKNASSNVLVPLPAMTGENGSGNETDICEETEMMSTERCRHGEAVIDESAQNARR